MTIAQNIMQMILLQPDTYIWLMVLAMTIVSALLFFICRRRKRWFKLLCIVFALACWYILLYGTFIGFGKIEVRRVELAFKDLPEAFDGYRIVQFGDVHAGSYTGWREQILRQAIDSINAQKADLVVFTGDLQNKRAEEIVKHKDILSSIKAKDGIYSVMGNHDYPEYIDAEPIEKMISCEKTMGMEMELGWELLLNSHHRIRRGNQRIVIAGMENDGEGRFPQLGNISSTLSSLNRESFVIMLEHDPTSWRRKILPHSHVQLTLSGHTHGGQFSLFGWSPASLAYREYDGLYRAGNRMLFVTKGLGGVVPFRFGVSGEIVVITLKKLRE